MTTIPTAYTSAGIFDGHRHHADAAIVVEDGRVLDVCQIASLATDIQRIDLGDGLLVPGLVDLQVNGGGGAMLNNDPTPETIIKMCEAHATHGTTSLLPTLITDTPDQTHNAVSAVDHCLKNRAPGVLGLHLEGPHLSVARKGAHDPALIRPMTETDAGYLEQLADVLPTLLLTLAPESVSNGQISRLSSAGAVVSLGHTDCGFATAIAAVKSGATAATHLFNAMSPLGSREPGMIGAMLESGEISAGLIADGYHVDPATIAIALRSKTGPGRIFLVSDAMGTIGSDVTEFELNGRQIFRDNGRLTLADGTLAGADIDLMSAVRFMVKSVGLDIGEAVRMATLYPAQLIGRSSEIGALVAGSMADFVHLNDDLTVNNVWRRGVQLD